MMRKSKPATSPDAYVAALRGWRRTCVETLRRAVRSAATMDEVIKWGHLVYLSSGPVLLVRAEESRVLLGFWRGQRLRGIESDLVPGGKYEMATMEFRKDSSVVATRVRRLAREAAGLNRKLGDPTLAAKRKQGA